MNMKRTLPLVGLLLALACSEGNPVAPSGTILTVNASPNRVGRSGEATITVTGRKPDGNPIVSGTDIFFSTNLGTIESLVEADGNGRAVATLRGDGRVGTASITVSLDGTTGGGGGGGGDGGGDGGGGTPPSTVTGTNSVTISVQLGSAPTLTVSINPDNIAVGDSATVTIIAQNEDGAPVESEPVTLISNLGTLRPPNPTLGSDGIARSTLRAGDQAGMATVQAFLGSVTGMGTLTIRDTAAVLTISANPSTVTTSSAVNIVLTVSALNNQDEAVQGIGILFSSPIGTFDPTNRGITNAQGQATVTLALTQDDVENNSSVTVRASTSQLEAFATISLPGS